MSLLVFNKPKTNIQRAFGLFALLQKSGYTRKELCPTQKFIAIDTDLKEFYSVNTEIIPAVDIPGNYSELIPNC